MLKLASVEPTFLLQDIEPSSPSGPVLIDVPLADPLGADEATDTRITLTDRQLARILFIAAETGGRFEREECSADPVAWLYSPRKLFGGRPAVQACQLHEHFIQAIVLHSLSLGLDAAPEDVDALLDAEDTAQLMVSPENQAEHVITASSSV